MPAPPPLWPCRNGPTTRPLAGRLREAPAAQVPRRLEKLKARFAPPPPLHTDDELPFQLRRHVQLAGRSRKRGNGA
jgi:hypothetical protein